MGFDALMRLLAAASLRAPLREYRPLPGSASRRDSSRSRLLWRRPTVALALKFCFHAALAPFSSGWIKFLFPYPETGTRPRSRFSSCPPSRRGLTSATGVSGPIYVPPSAAALVKAGWTPPGRRTNTATRRTLTACDVARTSLLHAITFIVSPHGSQRSRGLYVSPLVPRIYVTAIPP